MRPSATNSQAIVSSRNDVINPYIPPSESDEPLSSDFDVESRVLPSWISIVWDATLFIVFGFYFQSMVAATSRLFARQPLDLQTVSKLPERWILAFFLLSLSAYFAVKRHALWRLIYGVVAISFLFQHFPTGWIGDLITTAIATVVFLPVFTHGFGWIGVARYSCGMRIEAIAIAISHGRLSTLNNRDQRSIGAFHLAGPLALKRLCRCC